MTSIRLHAPRRQPRALALLLILGTAPLAGGQIPFEPLVALPLAHGAHDVTLADLDGDGALDLLTTPEPDGFGSQNVTYEVLAGLGDGTLAAPVAGSTFTSTSFGRGVVVDLDGDGRLEWVSPAGMPLGWVRIFPGTDGLLYGPPAFVGNSAATNGAESRVVDLNGDGHLDIVFLGITGPFDPGGSFSALLSDGAGGWVQVPGQPAALGGGHGLAVGDLDGDGLQDVVLTNSTAFQTVSVYLATGAASWAPATQVDCGDGVPNEAELLDVDGDGHLDLLVADSTGGVLFLPGDGNGGFGLVVSSPAPGGALFLAVGDLDGDGAVDVVLSTTLDGLQVLKGAGDGTFEVVNSFACTYPRGVDLGDLDGDGDLDVAVALNTGVFFGPDTVAVLLNRSYGAGSPFTDLGLGLAGSAGLPIQLAEGSLLAGTPFAFELFGAVPSDTAFAVVGLSALLAPFKGGVLVPTPDLILPAPTDGAGHAVLGGTWPGGMASGLAFWSQWWFDDAAAPKGKAASNALAVVVP